MMEYQERIADEWNEMSVRKKMRKRNGSCLRV